MPHVSVKDLDCFYQDDYFGTPWIEQPPVSLLQAGLRREFQPLQHLGARTRRSIPCSKTRTRSGTGTHRQVNKDVTCR